MFYRCLYDDQIFLKDLWFEFCKMGITFRLQTDSYDPCHGNLSGDHRLNSCNFSLRSSHCSRPFFFVLKTTVSEYRGRKQSETTMPCLAMGLVKRWYDGRGSTAQWTSEQKAFSIASSFQIFHWSFAWFELVGNHVEPQDDGQSPVICSAALFMRSRVSLNEVGTNLPLPMLFGTKTGKEVSRSGLGLLGWQSWHRPWLGAKRCEVQYFEGGVV